MNSLYPEGLRQQANSLYLTPPPAQPRQIVRPPPQSATPITNGNHNQTFQTSHPERPTLPNQRHAARVAPSQSLIAQRQMAVSAASVKEETPLTSPTVASLLGPRIDHLELTVKEIVENVTVVDKNQKEFEHMVNGSWLIAEVVSDTMEFVSADDDFENAMKQTTPSPVKKGEKISVSYPMVESTLNSQTVYMMRRRFVDPTTAEIGCSWCIVHTPSATPEENDVAHVSNFSFF